MIELNKIYNEDCFNTMDRIEDHSIDLVVTDPPYDFSNGNWLKSGVVGENSILGKGSIYDTEGEMYNEMSSFGEDDIDRLLSKLVVKMKKVNMYICCNETQVPIYGMWARKNNLHFSIITLEKPLSIINKNRFSMNTEYVVRIYDFGTGLNSLDNNELYSRVIRVSFPKGADKIHPTQKSVSLFSRFILLSSKEGNIVFDPFSGSGTTAIACIRNNRKFICCEKNEKFYNSSCRRIEQENATLTLF